jgi:hypothetical protein
VVSTSLLRNATWANGFAFNHFLANGREVAWESRSARPQRIGVAARNAPVPLPAHASTADTHTFTPAHAYTHFRPTRMSSAHGYFAVGRRPSLRWASASVRAIR